MADPLHFRAALAEGRGDPEPFGEPAEDIVVVARLGERLQRLRHRRHVRIKGVEADVVPFEVSFEKGPQDIVLPFRRVGWLALVFPLTHLVVLVRSLALGWLGWGLLWNLAYLVGFSFVLFPVAIARMRKRLIV